ncbi:MAG: methylated-DNA--[protein]-cysteine S-methyltransferase [Sphaerochaetaceae bacterium]
MENFYQLYPMAVGEILIAEKGGFVTDVGPTKNYTLPFKGTRKETSLLKRTYEQLDQFFKGERQEFDVPLKTEGTVFQQSVWEALKRIPYGQTRSYKEIAIAIGNPKAMRAVGMANNRNPISFIIPCHRVIGADGSLVGYGGGLEMKVWLLNLEKQVKGH